MVTTSASMRFMSSDEDMPIGLWPMAYGLTIWFPGSSGITGKSGGKREEKREERGELFQYIQNDQRIQAYRLMAYGLTIWFSGSSGLTGDSGRREGAKQEERGSEKRGEREQKKRREGAKQEERGRTRERLFQNIQNFQKNQFTNYLAFSIQH